MQLTHRILLSGATLGVAGAFASPVLGQTIDLAVNLPQLSVAEYHKPYVAIWLEKAGGATTTLSVLYDMGKRNDAGVKWLRDMRMWWRASGRTLKLPADGVTGATRAPGAHKMSFTAGRGGMPALTPGAYTLVIEAARESGGREMLRLPFTWSAAGRASAGATGKFELGAVSLTARR